MPPAPDTPPPGSGLESGHGSWPELEELARLRKELLALVADLPEPEQTTRQAPGGGWTPTQVLQHLLQVEELLLAGMDRAEAATGSSVRADAGDAAGDAAGDRARHPGGPTLRQRVGGVVVRVVFLLGIRVRMPTRRVAPGPPLSLKAVQARWMGEPSTRADGDVRDHEGATGVAPALHQRLRAAQAANPATPVMVHPVSGPLTPRATAAFLLQHMKHHRRQLRRILAARTEASSG